MNRHAGLVPVDSGLVLCVDPGHLPVDVLRAICQPNAHGVTSAVVSASPLGDGWWEIQPPDWQVLDWDELRPVVDEWEAGGHP